MGDNLQLSRQRRRVDARVKPAHDGVYMTKVIHPKAKPYNAASTASALETSNEPGLSTASHVMVPSSTIMA